MQEKGVKQVGKTERHAAADGSLQAALNQKRGLDKKGGAANQRHHLQFVPAGIDRELDRIGDNKKCRKQEEAAKDGPGHFYQADKRLKPLQPVLSVAEIGESLFFLQLADDPVHPRPGATRFMQGHSE